MEILIPIFGIMLFLVPITGLTLILTMRFALKPFVETLASALRDSGYASPRELQAQVDDLSDQLQVVGDELSRLRDAQAFDRSLLGAGSAERPPQARP